MPTTVFRNCPVCEATRGVAITTAGTSGNRVVLMRGDDADPFSRGSLCREGAARADLRHGPDRLRRPVVRDGSAWRELGWDAAFDRVATRLQEVRKAHGYTVERVAVPRKVSLSV